MKNNLYKTIAETSLAIIDRGSYTHNDRLFDIKEKLDRSILNTFTISPEEGDILLTRELKTIGNTAIIVENASAIEALLNVDPQKTAILNFASAKNPGGGFIGGASAQEESLARSSGLYATLIKDRTMYDYNRSKSTFLYSDYMIYSPDVLFWMKDDGTFLDEPIAVDVITAPAPNKGAMLQHNRQQEIEEIEAVFRKRMDKVLALAHSQRVDCLILGAWGCGVFRNETRDVARWFREALETTYDGVFQKVVFAIYDRSKTKDTLSVFEKEFGMSTVNGHN